MEYVTINRIYIQDENVCIFIVECHADVHCISMHFG